MANVMLGGIVMFGGNFAPKDYAYCAGQLDSISQNQALFAILGNTWGGDARTTYGLPDLRSRVPLGVGRGIGLTQVFPAQLRGTEIRTLTYANLPAHTHDATFVPTSGGGSVNLTGTADFKSSSSPADSNSPSAGTSLGTDVKLGLNQIKAYNSNSPDVVMQTVTVNVNGPVPAGSGTVAVEQTGGSCPFYIRNPYLGMNYIISLQGYFPSRN